MNRINTVLMNKSVALKVNNERYAASENDRMARASNIAVFLQDNWDTLTGIGRAISCKRLRDLMIECIGQFVRNSKNSLLASLPRRNSSDQSEREVRAGDDRANGDAIGDHLLRLACEDRILEGKRAKVLLLNEENKKKIDTFLQRVSNEPVEVIS